MVASCVWNDGLAGRQLRWRFFLPSRFIQYLLSSACVHKEKTGIQCRFRRSTSVRAKVYEICLPPPRKGPFQTVADLQMQNGSPSVARPGICLFGLLYLSKYALFIFRAPLSAASNLESHKTSFECFEDTILPAANMVGRIYSRLFSLSLLGNPPV